MAEAFTGQPAVRVLMAGPMPPAIGGMVSVMRDLRESNLRNDFLVDGFDTAKKTSADRSLWTAIRTRLALWRDWHRQLSRRPALAHIHTCSGLSYFLDVTLLWIARLHRVPVVLHIHGGRFDTFLDGLDPVRRAIARGAARSARCVIVLSDGWRERLQPRLPGARLQVIENGVPVATFERKQDESTAPLVLFLGGICRDKGVADLVRAFARVPGAARLAIVGPETQPGFLATVRALADELRLGSRVEFPGAADGAVKAAWLARADIFVLPSYAEALPIALLESMAAGLPTIATPVGAIPNVIDAGRTGLLVPPGDVDALATELQRLVTDPALRQSIGRAAREECVRRFSIDRAAATLRAVYREIAPQARWAAA